MNGLFNRIYDKVVFALALIAAAMSASWLWRERVTIRSLQRDLVRPGPTGSVYVPEKLRSPVPHVALWSEPPAQSRGSGWLYDVFTPPAITYVAAGRAFAVTPCPPANARPAEPGVQLLAVKREPYRLQLVGYFGQPGDYRAVFANLLSQETLLARGGDRFEQLGLSLKSFDVAKVAVDGGESTPAYEVAAVAILRDDTAGTEVVLDSRTRKLTDRLVAVFKPSSGTSGSRELHEGDTLAGGDDSFQVERIQLEPPEVGLRWTLSGQPEAEIRVLRPVGQITGQATPNNPRVPKATTDVAASNP